MEKQRRPITRLDKAGDITKALEKKHNRSRINQFSRLGALSFRQITDPNEFRLRYDEMITLHEARQLAAFGVSPYREDPNKKPFHIAMHRTPGLLNVALLELDGRIIAGHIGNSGRGQVHLGHIMFSPLVAKQSPAMLLLFMLVDHLAKSGYARLDLTPAGRASYKNRLADAEDEVYVLSVFPSVVHLRMHLIAKGFRAFARSTLRHAHVDTAELKRLSALLRQPSSMPRLLMRVLRRLRLWCYRNTELRLYTMSAARAASFGADPQVSQNSLDDLLAFQPERVWVTRQRFMARAWDRLAAGAHCFTYAGGGRLLSWIWFWVGQEKAFITEVHQDLRFAANSVVMQDGRTIEPARGRGLFTRVLTTALRRAGAAPGVERVVLLVDANNWASRHVIERVGFEYAGSLFERVRLGRARRWSAISPSSGAYVEAAACSCSQTIVCQRKGSAEDGVPGETAARASIGNGRTRSRRTDSQT